MNLVTEVNQVDAHVEEHHDTIASLDASSMDTTKFCVIYTGAKPILNLAKNLLFFKPKWQTILKAFIAGLDTICPPAGN